MRHAPRLLLGIALGVIALVALLAVPVVTLGPRLPDTRASAQRAPAPTAPVPVQAVGYGVLSGALGVGFVVAQVWRRPGRTPRRRGS